MPKKQAKNERGYRERIPDFSSIIKDVEVYIKKDPVKSVVAAFGIGLLLGSVLNRGGKKK